MNRPLKLWHVLLLVVLFAPVATWGANTMFSALTALTGANLAGGDKFVLLDVSDTTDGAGGTGKTITTDNLRFGIAGGSRFKLGSDYSVSSTTGTEITGIGPMTVSAAGTYHLYCILITQSAAAGTGFTFGVNFTGSAPSPFVANARYATSGTSATNGTADDIAAVNTGSLYEADAATARSTTTPNLGPNAGVTNANTNIMVIVEALMTTSDTGDIEVWGANETGASAITVKAGSYCDMEPMQ